MTGLGNQLCFEQRIELASPESFFSKLNYSDILILQGANSHFIFLKVQGSGEQELLVDNSKHGKRKDFSGGKKCENSCLLTPYFDMQTTFTLNSFFTFSFFTRGNFLNEH